MSLRAPPAARHDQCRIPGAIEPELDRIRSLGLTELRLEWRRLNHGEPPKISRDLLALALGYQLQEREHGGLSKSTRRKLQTIAKALRTTGRVARRRASASSRARGLVPRMAWPHPYRHGDRGRLRAEGTSYASLTMIARKITGSPLVRAPVLRAAGAGDGCAKRRGRRWLNRTRDPDGLPRAAARDLHPQVHRRGPGPGLQLPRCPARGLRGLRPVAEA